MFLQSGVLSHRLKHTADFMHTNVPDFFEPPLVTIALPYRRFISKSTYMLSE